MENLILFLATSFAIRLSAPQQRPFKQRTIGNTGCSALLSGGQDFTRARTRNGDDMYYGRCSEGGVTYGVICVDMNRSASAGDTRRLLSAYIEKLKHPFRIAHQIGLAPESDWNHTDTTALTDYWQDKNGRDWKVKGYTNGQLLAVLYVRNIGQAPVQKQEDFLDGFRFATAV